ncbi:MAG: haloacid dehalogenase type II [Mycobacteriales bacterium]
MTDRPSVVVFDVNETLSDMRPMADRFTDLGLPPQLAAVWFASVLRDGFALAAAGSRAPFAAIADGALRTVFAGQPPDRDTDAAVEHVMQGFTALQVHPDVPPGVRALTDAGLRLVTLSNGSAAVADTLLSTAGLRESFERLLTVEDAVAWKPVRAAYEHAAQQCQVELGDMLLVAVHPWDIDGAARAGLQTAWADRSGTPYPPHFTPPTRTVSGIDDLARQLADGSTA